MSEALGNCKHLELRAPYIFCRGRVLVAGSDISQLSKTAWSISLNRKFWSQLSDQGCFEVLVSCWARTTSQHRKTLITLDSFLMGNILHFRISVCETKCLLNVFRISRVEEWFFDILTVENSKKLRSFLSMTSGNILHSKTAFSLLSFTCILMRIIDLLAK